MLAPFPARRASSARAALRMLAACAGLAAFALAARVARAAGASPDPAVLAGCSVRAERGDPAAADARLAAAACDSARARFGALFGGTVAPVTIVLRPEPGYRVRLERGGVTVLWADGATLAATGDAALAAASRAAPDGARPAPPGTAAAAAAADSAGAPTAHAAAVARHVASQWRDALPHEITHGLLAAHFYPAGFAAAPASYGTPLPDWFEEGIAIWSETASNRAGRLAQARRLPAHRLDLPSILAMPHPGIASAAAMASRDGGALPSDEALWSFYPQALAVVAFVHAHGGDAALAEVGRRLVGDPAATDALAGLPGLPADMPAVVHAWQRWLASP